MDLEGLSLVQLKEMAKDLGIKNVSRMRKAELVELISAHKAASEEVTSKKATNKKASSKSPGKKVSASKSDVADSPTKSPGKKVSVSKLDVVDSPSKSPSKKASKSPKSKPDAKESHPPPIVQDNGATISELTKLSKLDSLDSGEAKAEADKAFDTVDFNDIDSTSSNIPSIEAITTVTTPQQEPETSVGILEILPDGFGFLRVNNFLPSSGDIYISPTQIRRFNLRNGDLVCGTTRSNGGADKFSALSFIQHVNGEPPYMATRRPYFEYLTPIFPTKRITLESTGG